MDLPESKQSSSLKGMKSLYETKIQGTKVPVKSWTRGVFFEEQAQNQLRNIAQLPIIPHSIAAMPDVHLGKGATIGTVLPTIHAIIPAAVGVDIGCGMMAVRTSLKASQLPENLKAVRSSIERTVPHGRTSGRKRKSGRDKGSFEGLLN